MNSGRALTFILLSSVFMMGAIMLQSVFAPKKPDPNDAQAPVANQVDQLDDQQDAGADPNLKLADQATDDEAVNDDGSAKDDDATKDDVAAQAEGAPTTQRVAEDDFVMLGSLAADGSDRYLITVNKRGGTIRRVELNFRDQKGRYKFRDLVWEGGYLGCLDCLATDKGTQVRCVGKGTPAQIAGVQVGDLIKSINGEPITSPEDFETYLESKTKAKTEIDLVVSRNGQDQTLMVGLTKKPIQIIRPESGIVDPNFDYPESFVMSLVNPAELDKAWPDLDADMRDSNWEVTQHTNSGVELSFELSPASLSAQGITGPITVKKRFTLPTLAVEDLKNLDSRTFHLKFEVEFENGSDQPYSLAYEIDGPTGLTAETWWYANKIHGRQTAIGYIAGARDIVGQNGVNSYVFYGCPEIVKDAQKTVPKFMYICDPFEEDDRYRELKFVGVDSHYFNVSMIPTGEEPFATNSIQAYPNRRDGQIPTIPKNARLQKLVDCTYIMVAPLELAPHSSVTKSFDIFVGPKDPIVLKHYGLGDVQTFGWFSWCSMVLLKLLHFFYWMTFKTSYGLAIILLTVLVRCMMIPMSRKAALNAQMMQHLQPQMKEIADKYKDDMEKRSSAQRELYKKYNFNPFGGCFMMFFQLPIFYGLYKGLNVDIALRDQPLIPGMQWCSNLAAPDQLLYWKDWMPAALGAETGWLGPYFNLLPILTMILFIAQQKLFTPPPTDDNQKMMHKMMTFMMVFMGIMFFKVPAGLCIYFITSSLWGIIERKMLPKPVLNTDKLAIDGGPTSKAAKKLKKAETQDEQKRVSDAAARTQRNANRKKKLNKRRRDGGTE